MYHKEKFLSTLGLMKRAGKLVYGDDLLPYVAKGQCFCVVLCEDASARTQKQIQDKCKTYGVPVIVFTTRDELSDAIGMNNRVSVGITTRGFVKALMKSRIEIEEVSESYE